MPPRRGVGRSTEDRGDVQTRTVLCISLCLRNNHETLRPWGLLPHLGPLSDPEGSRVFNPENTGDHVRRGVLSETEDWPVDVEGGGMVGGRVTRGRKLPQLRGGTRSLSPELETIGRSVIDRGRLEGWVLKVLTES